MKIETYVKHQNMYFPVYWIRRNKNNITGAFDGNLYRSILHPSVDDLDIHFTYPQDGRLHYSIKSHSGGIEERFFVNSERNSQNREGNVLVQNRSINLFSHMLPDMFLPSLAAYSSSDSIHQFPMSAISYLHGTLFYSSARKRSDLKGGRRSIIIDLEKYGDITINPCALLAGKDYDIDSFLKTTSMSVVDDTTFPIIVLYANISPR